MQAKSRSDLRNGSFFALCSISVGAAGGGFHGVARFEAFPYRVRYASGFAGIADDDDLGADVFELPDGVGVGAHSEGEDDAVGFEFGCGPVGAFEGDTLFFDGGEPVGGEFSGGSESAEFVVAYCPEYAGAKLGRHFDYRYGQSGGEYHFGGLESREAGAYDGDFARGGAAFGDYVFRCHDVG